MACSVSINHLRTEFGNIQINNEPIQISDRTIQILRQFNIKGNVFIVTLYSHNNVKIIRDSIKKYLLKKHNSTVSDNKLNDIIFNQLDNLYDIFINSISTMSDCDSIINEVRNISNTACKKIKNKLANDINAYFGYLNLQNQRAGKGDNPLNVPKLTEHSVRNNGTSLKTFDDLNIHDQLGNEISGLEYKGLNAANFIKTNNSNQKYL